MDHQTSTAHKETIGMNLETCCSNGHRRPQQPSQKNFPFLALENLPHLHDHTRSVGKSFLSQAFRDTITMVGHIWPIVALHLVPIHITKHITNTNSLTLVLWTNHELAGPSHIALQTGSM